MAYTPYNQGLTLAEMEVNAVEIAQILLARGWTLNAIAGALGNFQNECKLNPNDPQKATGFPDSVASREKGFGLPQWTPWYSRYGTWCNMRGIAITATDDNPAGQLLPQLDYLEHECTYGLGEGKKTWYSNHGYSLTWTAYKKSTAEPGWLADAFYWQYERSDADGSTTRPAQAEYWYEFLSGQTFAKLPIWLLFKIRDNNMRKVNR